MTWGGFPQVNSKIHNSVFVQFIFLLSYSIRYYSQPTKLREDNVFTRVCLSVCPWAVPYDYYHYKGWLVPPPGHQIWDPSPSPVRFSSGQYAPYWNAFLLIIEFSCMFCTNSILQIFSGDPPPHFEFVTDFTKKFARRLLGN